VLRTDSTEAASFARIPTMILTLAGSFTAPIPYNLEKDKKSKEKGTMKKEL
jgi:hypothetical protein